MDKKEIIKKILKEVSIVLAIVILPIIFLLVYASIAPELNNIFSMIVVGVCALVPAYGAPWYLIHKYAKGMTKKVLYVLLVLYVPVISVLTGDKQEMIATTTDFVHGLLNIALPILIIVLIIKGVSYFRNNILKIDRSRENGKIASIKGYHLYGLSTNEGDKVIAELYQGKIVFRYAGGEEERVEKDRIVSISSRTQQEIVGQIITEKRKGSVTSTIAALNGDWGAALFFGNRPSTYETKNKVETYWFLEVDTTTISVILQVKSSSALRQFVDLCNRTLQPSRDYAADDYDEELDGCKEQTPSLKEQVNIAAMDGQQFEIFCAQLLQDNGWINVIHTPNSGDQGVDIIAEKDGIKYAIQCKHYSQPVGNTAVQEVTAGKQFYHCHVAVVLTNSIFTKSATDLAKANNVLLWDNYKLDELIKIAGYTGHS